VQPDGSAVFDDWNGNIRAVRADGSEKWTYPFSGNLYAGEQSVAPDGSVAFGSTDSHFYVLNDDGTERTSRPFPSGVFSPVCRDSAGRFYVSNGNDPSIVSSESVEGGRIFCLDENLNELWSWQAEPAWQSRPSIDGSGRLFMMQKDGTAYVLSATP
jgi:hypothetical protein